MSVGIDLANQPAFGDRTALGLAASAAEQIGYTSVWVPAGVAAGQDAVLVAAAATDRIRLGVALDAHHSEDLAGEVAALEHLVGERLVVVVRADRVDVATHGGPATVLLADLPAARLPHGAAGWSPLDPALTRLTAASGLVVPRVRVRITEVPLAGARPDWQGSLRQVTGDVTRAVAAGVTEVVVALHDRPPFDEALERWAVLAEAVELAISR